MLTSHCTCTYFIVILNIFTNIFLFFLSSFLGSIFYQAIGRCKIYHNSKLICVKKAWSRKAVGNGFVLYICSFSWFQIGNKHVFKTAIKLPTQYNQLVSKAKSSNVTVLYRAFNNKAHSSFTSIFELATWYFWYGHCNVDYHARHGSLIIVKPRIARTCLPCKLPVLVHGIRYVRDVLEGRDTLH